MLLVVFTSNLDDNGSNLLLSYRIALTMYSVLLSKKIADFDRRKILEAI